jgi:phage terminase small subunit
VLFLLGAVNDVKLTEKQKRFADHYIETGNATESYRRAYDCTDNTARVEGFKNLDKPSVKKYLDERFKHINSDKIASQTEIMEYLTAVMRAEVTEEVPVSTKKGVVLVEARAGIKDRNKAAELMGKRYVMWTDKKELEGNIGVKIVDDIDHD